MIRLDEINLHRGSKSLLEKASLTLHHGQHVGLIGTNGCGKSSLFALLNRKLQPDAGSIGLPPNKRIAHMEQEVVALDRSALDYVLDGDQRLREIQEQLHRAEAEHDNNAIAHALSDLELHDGYTAQSRAEKLLHGLGFNQNQLQLNVRDFSGGWRMRLNLARTLMSPSDLLLLDEPTNHLDLDAIIWLEEWLQKYPGTLIIISHDRDFLDTVVDHIVHIEQRKITHYRGNYSAFERTRAERLAQQQASYEKQQRVRAHMQSYVDRFRAKATKAKQAQSRLKALSRMEEIAPAHIDSPFKFSFPESEQTSSPLLNIQKGDLGYNDIAILKQVNLSILPGTRIGLLGPNGAGKSTLIKALAGQTELVCGERSNGEHLAIGYFAQHQLENLDDNASPILHIQRLSPMASEQEIRNFLGSFGFQNDQATGSIESFSGGEKARLALAIIAWQKPNLLLLDEPTNHLDLEMRHALTMALQSFQGAIIVVSHDRHLLRNTVDQLLLVNDGQVSPWQGDLDEYTSWLEMQRRAEKQQATNKEQRPASSNISAADRKEQKRQQAAHRSLLQPLKKELAKLEKKLESVQENLLTVEDQLADASLYESANKDKLKALLNEQSAMVKQAETLEETWLLKQEELEQLQNSQ